MKASRLFYSEPSRHAQHHHRVANNINLTKFYFDPTLDAYHRSKLIASLSVEGQLHTLTKLQINCATALRTLICILVLLFVIAAPESGTTETKANTIVSNERSDWRPFRDNMEVKEIAMRSLLFFKSHITLLRFNLSDYRIAVVRATDFGMSRSTTRVLCQKARALACINANFFDESGKPLGLVVTRGMTLQGLHRGGGTLTGIFQVSRQNPSIVNRNDYNPESIVEAIQAGPRLIANNKKIPGLKEASASTRRSGVCIDKSNRIVFFAMSAGFFGLSLEELRDILLSESIDCRDALNLDGGGSTQLFAEARISSSEPSSAPLIDVEGTDEVPVALAVFPRS